MPDILGHNYIAGGQIASELTSSVLLGCGQFCTSPGLVIGIRSREFTAFLESFAALMNEQSAQTMLNAGTLKSYSKGLELLQEEVFGPTTVVVEVADKTELLRALHGLHGLHGQLTATLIAEAADLDGCADLLALLEQKAGRVLLNGYPTGVEVCDSMVHGGPYPATSDARGTSVGTPAIDRFLRPVCYQNCPDALKNANPLGLQRLVDGAETRAALG